MQGTSLEASLCLDPCVLHLVPSFLYLGPCLLYLNHIFNKTNCLGTIILIFILGYAAIAFEHTIRINKAATALITGVLCWTVYILLSDSKETVVSELTAHLGELSQILFFLMSAMAIVELIDAHDGFEIITQPIRTARG